MAAPLVGRDADIDRVRAALEASRLVCVVGPPGVGKTRLVLAATPPGPGEDGATLVSATRCVAAGPLAPFASIAAEVGLTLPGVHVALRARGPGRLLVVDDVHDLDDVSATLVRQIVDEGAPPLLLVGRDTTAWPNGLAGLLDDPRATVLVVEPLPLEAVRALTGSLVPDGDRALADAAARRSGGNPLLATELVRADVQGPARVAPLADLVGLRLDELGDGATDLVAAATLVQDLPVDVAVALSSSDALDEVERAGHLAVVDGALRFAHPVHEEAARAGLAPRRPAVAARLVGLVDDRDPLRLALLHLEAGHALPVVLACEAADVAVARPAPGLARRLLGAVEPGSGDVAAVVARRVCAAELDGAPDTAIELAREALVRDDLGRGLRATIVRHAVRALLQVRDDEGAASELAARERHRIDDAGRVALDAELALRELARGDTDRVRALHDDTAGAPQAPGVVAVQVVWLVNSGRTDTARRMLADVTAELGGWEAEDPLAAALVRAAGAHLDAMAGDLASADRVLRRGRTRAASLDDPFARAFWASQQALASWLSGRPAEAADAADAARRTSGDPLALTERLVLPVRAASRCQLGDVAGAADDLAAAGAIDRDDVRLATFGPFARLWTRCLHTEASDDDAMARFHADCAAAAERGMAGFVVPVLHGAARLGLRGRAHDLAVELTAGRRHEPLVDAQVAHLAAVGAADAVGLAAAGDAFHGMGHHQFAAEAWAQAAAAGTGGPVRARLLARRRLVVRDLEPVAGPWSGVVDETISDRLLDVAVLAADGRTSREIAAHMTLSVRTVDNHLGLVYRALGVGGRDELADALATPRTLVAA